MIEGKILESFVGSRCVVTGGTGLIGREVVKMLCDVDAMVRIVSLDNIIVDPRAIHTYVDLTDMEACLDVTWDADFVFHLAGIKGSIEVTKTKPASFFVPLLQFNTNVLEACRLNKVEKVVYTSSIGAYPSAEVFTEDMGMSGEPMDMFPGWAKRMAEMQIRAYKIQYGLNNFSVVRPCSVYGPGDDFNPNNAMVIPTLMYRIYNGEDPVVVWGNGSAIRDFAFSRDIAEGIILALYYGTGLYPFVNLGSGIGYTIKELVETLASFIDFHYEFDTTKSSGFPKRVMDISYAKKQIHYNPTTSLRDGLMETWKWFTQNQTEYLKRKNYFADRNY